MNKYARRLPTIIFLGILLLLSIFVFTYISSSSYTLYFSAINLLSNPSEDSLNDYVAEANEIIQIHKLELGITKETYLDNLQLLNKYLKDLSTSEPSFTPSLIELNNNIETTKLDFNYQQSEDTEYPQGYFYTKRGSLGAIIKEYWDVQLAYQDEMKENTGLVSTIKIEPSNEIIYSGKKDLDEIKNNVKSLFDLFLKGESSIDSDYSNLKYPEDKSRFENITIDEIFISGSKKEILNQEELFSSGNLQVKLGNCNKIVSLGLNYRSSTKRYSFESPQSFLDKLCIKQFEDMGGYLLGTCTECTLYPSDKTHAIRADYAPEVVSIDFAPGFQRINKIAFEDFYQLYNAAKNSNIYLFVTSGYRSYADQLATFSYWTSVEMSKGYSRAQAEAIANTYSARAGFSEHQLGTALDLNGAGCDAFAACTGNQAAWNWLAANAHNYGFVISYPESKQSQTGYIFEPWHYRWIGKELALEYKKVESEKTLQQFLFELGRY